MRMIEFEFEIVEIFSLVRILPRREIILDDNPIVNLISNCLKARNWRTKSGHKWAGGWWGGWWPACCPGGGCSSGRGSRSSVTGTSLSRSCHRVVHHKPRHQHLTQWWWKYWTLKIIKSYLSNLSVWPERVTVFSLSQSRSEVIVKNSSPVRNQIISKGFTVSLSFSSGGILITLYFKTILLGENYSKNFIRSFQLRRLHRAVLSPPT